MRYNCIIVGLGFAGTVIARKLAEAGKHVLVFEKRSHIAGNMYDEHNVDGLLVQKYGPHIFHTSNQDIIDFIKLYSEWIDYRLEMLVYMENKFTPSPFNFQTIDDYFSVTKSNAIKSAIKEYYGDIKYDTIVNLLKSKVPIIKEYAQFLYDKDYGPYTAKQWGISPNDIDISVLNRVPVLFSYDTGYFRDRFQALPKNGFTKLFENMLNHPNIEVHLNEDIKNHIAIDYQKNMIIFEGKELEIPLVYTGALDDLLDYKYGILPYRSIYFEHSTLNIDSFQDAAVVAYPQEKKFTRITEYKKLPIQNVDGVTTIVKEFPVMFCENNNSDVEPYYPILNNRNIEMYSRYLDDVKKIENIFLAGRLADYKYYNMDNAIERAFTVFLQIIEYMHLKQL